MLCFDAHLDLAWNAIEWDRDLLLPVTEIRKCEQGMPGKGRGENTVSFPELRRGNVGVFIATLLARVLLPGAVGAFQRFRSMQAAYAAAHGQMAYYRALEQQGILRQITDWPTLNDHANTWMAVEEPAASAPIHPSSFILHPSPAPLGYILSMEGADPILSPDQVEEWWHAGLRIIGPAHYGVSPYAHGTGTEGGLFPQGIPLLKEMERTGMILDVTHLSDQSFMEALELFGGPVLASHHNCRALVPNQRQLADEHIKQLISRGAVIGMAFDAWMLYPNWIRGQTRPDEVGVKLETIIDHIDHICQLAGNATHVAIGSDLDGGFGREQSPGDLDTIADLQCLPDLLQQRGYEKEAIAGIMHNNWLRFFREAWRSSL